MSSSALAIAGEEAVDPTAMVDAGKDAIMARRVIIVNPPRSRSLLP
ncbi:hypothetical protein Z949_2456 [Sulfitobacter guttiformis KCTC 32187]|nr:hypothetical protein Z949_2456 [Sulfitobacter guttiformis KCTC 32187]